MNSRPSLAQIKQGKSWERINTGLISPEESSITLSLSNICLKNSMVAALSVREVWQSPIQCTMCLTFAGVSLPTKWSSAPQLRNDLVRSSRRPLAMVVRRLSNAPACWCWCMTSVTTSFTRLDASESAVTRFAQALSKFRSGVQLANRRSTSATTMLSTCSRDKVASTTR